MLDKRLASDGSWRMSIKEFRSSGHGPPVSLIMHPLVFSSLVKNFEARSMDERRHREGKVSACRNLLVKKKERERGIERERGRNRQTLTSRENNLVRRAADGRVAPSYPTFIFTVPNCICKIAILIRRYNNNYTCNYCGNAVIFP